MVPGFAWLRRQQVTVGLADPQLLWGACSSSPETKNPGARIYGSRIRVAPAAASDCRLCRPAALVGRMLEFSGNEEAGSLNLWFPDSRGSGGSK